MKKFFTLLLAAATVSAFAAPMQKMTVKQQPQLAANAQQADVKAQKGPKADMAPAKISTKALTDAIDTLYREPVGTFYSAYFPYTPTGGNPSLYYSYNGLLVPGNVDLTWRNSTTGYTGTYTWFWYNADLDAQNYQVSTDDNLVTNWRNDGYGFYYGPRLYLETPTTGNESYWQFAGGVQYGGKMEHDVYNDGTLYTNMSNFSPRDDYKRPMWIGATASGKDNDTTNADAGVYFWPEMLDEVEGADFAEIMANIAVFDAPAAPYSFSRIMLYAAANAQEGQEIKASVCRYNENGQLDLDNPIAETTYVFTENCDGESAMPLEFYFEKIDPVMGLAEEEWITINEKMAIVFTGGNELQYFCPIVVGSAYDAIKVHSDYSESRYALSLWYFYKDGSPIDAGLYYSHGGYYWGSQSSGYSLPSHYAVSINAQFPFIENDDEATAEKTINAAVEGETVELVLRSSEVYDLWNVSDDAPDWVTVEGVDELDDDGEVTGVVTLTVKVDALPSGETGRTGKYVFTLAGATYTITVNQGETGGLVGDVNQDGSINAADVTALYNYILNGDETFIATSDVNGDGAINAGDVTAVYNIILGL